MFTDGVTEAANRKGELFGEDRILAEASASVRGSSASTVSVLMEAVTRFSQGVPQADDITILTMRYAGPLTTERGKK